MTKEFKMIKDKLQVTVSLDDVIFIPDKDGTNEEIGTYTQTTVQVIKADKINILKEFMTNEKEKANKQLLELNKQLEPIKNIKDIDDKIITQCLKMIDKGSKAFKLTMNPLNKNIMELNKKKSIIAQIDYINKQLELVNSDLDALNKAIK